MKVVVTAKTDTLDAELDPRFGRCHYFLVVDTESMTVKSLSNESVMASGGAGIQAAQTVANTGAKVIITGNVGPNAFQTLSAAGIKVYMGPSGKVKDVIEKFKKGELQEVQAASVDSHFGMGGGTGRGLGRGR